MACPLAAEHVWVERCRYHDAERKYYERLAGLLKGSVGDQQIKSLPSNLNSEELKKKPKKTIRKTQSPETMLDSSEAIFQKSTPNAIVGRTKKHKKAKVVESEASTNGATKDVSPNKASDVISFTIEAVEETKAKKKKKKKTNKDNADNLQDRTSHKENIPPATIENNLDLNDSNKELKNHKNKGPSSNQCTLVSEIAKARQHIKNSLEKMDGIATLAASPASPDVLDRLAAIEKDNADLRKLIEGLKSVCIQSENRVKSIEQKLSAVNINTGKNTVNASPVGASKENNEDDDDGVDLFASDSEEDDAEATKIREARLAAYAAKKSKKPALIAKSSLVLDVKPWDDETDMKVLETEVRKIISDGLLWGASKCVPVAFGIQKLSISCVVEDEKISIDWLTEEIEKIEDYVQSVDVAAFNKI